MMGSLDVLNCGAGHLRFDFDKDDPQEAERAKRVIQDMISRGYSLFIEQPDGGGLVKVEGFDAATSSYIISDAPEPVKKRGGKGKKRRVPMTGSKATGVGPTAGG
jgi:hypothetical protein